MSAVNQIATMRLPNGKEVAFVDWSDKPLFSSADLRSGFTDEGFFVANATYLGLTLRDGDLAETRRVLQAMDDRFQRIERILDVPWRMFRLPNEKDCPASAGEHPLSIDHVQDALLVGKGAAQVGLAHLWPDI
mgnify:CR=1 FL=1